MRSAKKASARLCASAMVSPSGRRMLLGLVAQASSPPGNSTVSSARPLPVQAPVLISRNLRSVVTVSRCSRATSLAVSTARPRSLLYTAAIGSSASARASWRACARPRSVSGESDWPCHLPSTLKTVSPCRASRIRTGVPAAIFASIGPSAMACGGPSCCSAGLVAFQAHQFAVVACSPIRASSNGCACNNTPRRQSLIERPQVTHAAGDLVLVGVADQRQRVLTRRVQQVANLGDRARAVLLDLGANACHDLGQRLLLVQQAGGDFD